MKKHNVVMLNNLIKKHFVLKPSVLMAVLVVFFLTINSPLYALKLINEAFIPLEDEKEEFEGDLPGEQMGSAIAAGDFDRDGIEDLVTSSPFASTDENQWNGSVKIIFGNSNRNADNKYLQFVGEGSGDQFGTALAVGDFNDDSIDDLAIGAYNAQSDHIRKGRVYIVFGDTELSSQVSRQMNIRDINLLPGQEPVELTGQKEGDQFGLSLFAMDLNLDGVKDLFVGAPLASGYNFEKSGVVYVYFGSRQGLPTNSNFTFNAQSSGEKFGSALSGGHVTSQQRNDVVIGAYMSGDNDKQQTGRVYIFRYNSYYTYTDISKKIISGGQEKGWLGFALDVGNANGDEFDDLIISSFPYGGNRKNARISLFYGAKKLSKTADVIIEDPSGEAFLGADVKLKDLNADGKGDIIIGAPGIGLGKSMEEGSVYIVYSGVEPYKNHYSIKNDEYDAVLHGANPDDWFGANIGVLDFDLDGNQDLAVGSRYSDASDSVNNGKIFVMYGDGKAYGKSRAIMEQTDEKVSRGELLNVVINRLEIKKNKKEYIQNCYEHKEFCFFNFLAISSYKDIQLEPTLTLYPDVLPSNKYYDDINIATSLGLVNGYVNEPESPFYPDVSVSRIQALKIILGAADLVAPKYQFELVSMLGSYKDLLNQQTPFGDIDAKISSMWWFPRYVNFALEHDIIDKSDFFRPNDNITAKELDDIITRTVQYLKSTAQDEKAKPSGNSQN